MKSRRSNHIRQATVQKSLAEYVAGEVGVVEKVCNDEKGLVFQQAKQNVINSSQRNNAEAMTKNVMKSKQLVHIQ